LDFISPSHVGLFNSILDFAHWNLLEAIAIPSKRLWNHRNQQRSVATSCSFRGDTLVKLEANVDKVIAKQFGIPV
jgi:hypothetical protein